MDPKKQLYKTFFKNVFSDPFQLKFWDGEEICFGDGVPKFKIVFHKPIPIKDIIKDPALALGEGYMNGMYDIEESVQDVIESLYNNKDSFLNNSNHYFKLMKALSNNLKNSKNNVEHHYDVGNDFYQLWLDYSMTYSCAYFRSAVDSLNEAQKNKVEHILKKLYLQEGQTLLDIGCGWGDLIISAAKEYDVKALGITLSNEQFVKVKEKIKTENLEHLVDVKITDYRELNNMQFDRVVSVGMVEHVGKDHLPEYFQAVNRLLKAGGLSLLHSITGIHEGGSNTWINKYIFPGGYIPAVGELVNYIADSKFYLIDMESLRRHYAKTLEHWTVNFEKSIDEVRKIKDEVFIRMWRLYLNSCAASFKCGNIDIHQILFSKGLNDVLPWTREYVYV